MVDLACGYFTRANQRKPFNLGLRRQGWFTVHPCETSGEKQGFLDLRSKLLKSFSKRFSCAVDVQVVGLKVGDGCDGGMQVVKAAVKFVGFHNVP